MSNNGKDAVLTILPGLHYLAREAQSGGAGPVSGWIAETIERIVSWIDAGTQATAATGPAARAPAAAPIMIGYGAPDRLTTAISLKAALSYLLIDAEEADLSDTAQLLWQTVEALEDEMQGLARLN